MVQPSLSKESIRLKNLTTLMFVSQSSFLLMSAGSLYVREKNSANKIQGDLIPGKIAVSIKVVRLNSRRLTFPSTNATYLQPKAFQYLHGRHLPKTLKPFQNLSGKCLVERTANILLHIGVIQLYPRAYPLKIKYNEGYIRSKATLFPAEMEA